MAAHNPTSATILGGDEHKLTNTGKSSRREAKSAKEYTDSIGGMDEKEDHW